MNYELWGMGYGIIIQNSCLPAGRQAKLPALGWLDLGQKIKSYITF
jgi:hypothetical protein